MTQIRVQLALLRSATRCSRRVRACSDDGRRSPVCGSRGIDDGAPVERFSDRELYEQAVVEAVRRTADIDWVDEELVLTELRLDGTYPDTGLFVSVASARTGEHLLRRGVYALIMRPDK